MGKNKQAQRTKNNARPSNSSRSAELLGTATPNFVGFSAVKDGGYVPVLPGLTLCSINEIEMSNVDSNFRIVLKKMNKKDATTKYKALQEFAVMCRDSELLAVEGMLPFWPRIYCDLAIDIEHRVREAAQLAHAAVVKRVGKNIALYLKQLAGAWFTSQHDTYPPAASAANNSFNDTFPPKKVIDAIVHCQREILTYICDNITVHTAESLSLLKNLTVEEMESKYQRVLIASLQGYSFYLKKIPVQKIEKMIDIHHKIINNNKFWKLVKYDAPPVKAAFFNVLTSMIENAVILLKEQKKRTVTTIMNNLNDTEPSVLSAVWESMLATINKIEDWYYVVSVKKLVLPKLWRVLQSGGQCCASIIYPNLLPLVSQFPKLNVNVQYLYRNFFNDMRQGFFVKSVQMSRSEMFAVTTSFVECLRYSILLNVNNEDLCIELLKEQLMPSLEMCLQKNTPMRQILFCEITHLVRYWSKNRYNADYKSYFNLIYTFWHELNALFDSIINVSQNFETSNVSNVNNFQIEFLITLKTVPAHSRKNLKVKFSNPEEYIKVEYQTQDIKIDTDIEFLHELDNFVNSLCIKYFDKIIEQRTKKYVTCLNKLITCFESENLFTNLSKSLKTQVNFFSFYDQIVQSWLLEQSTETEDIVELIFNLIRYMNDVEKNNVLMSLTQFENIVTKRSVIQCALSKKYRNDPIVSKWCSQSKITSLLLDVAKEIASGNYSDLEKNQNLILLAFEPSDDDNLSIEEEGVNEIVFILCNSIHKVDETYLLHFAKLISCIVPLIWTHKRLTLGAVRLLETLFDLCSQDYFSNNSTFIETMRGIWTKGLLEAIQKLSHPALIELTKKFAIIMWKKIYNSNEEHAREILVDVAADFLEVIINNQVHIDEDYAQEIILTFLIDSNISTWMAEVTGIILYGEVISGKLYVSTLDQSIQIYQNCMSINLTDNAVMDNTENCLKWALFNANLLNTLCLRSINRDEEKGYNIKKPLIHDMNLPGIAKLLINIIYSIILGRIYTNHYKSTKYYSNVVKILITVQNSFKQIQMYINEDTHNEIVHYIKMNYSKYGSMLSYIIQFCCTELCTSKNQEELYKIYDNNNVSSIGNNEMNLQGQQILSVFQSSENTIVTTNNDIRELIVGRSMLINKENNFNYSSILEKIISSVEENSTLLLLDCDISQISWEKLTLPLEVVRLLTELVTKTPSKLTRVNWNFILISLVLWQLSVTKSERNANDFKVSAFTVAVCQLYLAIQNLFNQHEQEEITNLLQVMLDEWQNVVAGDIQCKIVRSWMFYADSYNEETTALKPVVVLDYLGKAVKMSNGNIPFKNTGNVSLESIDLNYAVKLSPKLFQASIISIQLGAYHLLKHAVPILVEQDKATVESNNFYVYKSNIRKMIDVLQDTESIVNSILMDFKLCDTVSCTIQPYTDSYTYVLGYLLSWAIVLDMCANIYGNLLHQYAEILEDNVFPSLLNNIFRLMPVEVLQNNKNKGTKLTEIFSTEPSLDFGESWTESRLDHIVCWLYTNSLRHLPMLVRKWWKAADSRVHAAVDKITTHYISPMLCQELLNNKLVNIENVQVKVHPSFREVVALYQMDDTKLELNITLPPNHPLGSVTVKPGQYAGGAVNWHMQLSLFLTHQNGSIREGLVLWKKNMDKKYAGVAECCICFSIFHIGTYQLPKLSCRMCRKKFHTACLYKWFSTGQKSTCPVCRSVF